MNLIHNTTAHGTTDVAGPLASFCREHGKLFVLTGAGCSTGSGIPDYRDQNGQWKHTQPVQYKDFVNQESTRKRYWSRAQAGWRRISDAQPNAAHFALAELERRGYLHYMVTQNVDGLHQKAGSHEVLNLHGQLDFVTCLSCGNKTPRADIQRWLDKHNKVDSTNITALKPDGDAELSNVDEVGYRVPYCDQCNGIIKPDVVFFGESVPRKRVEMAKRKLAESNALLVVGSSLVVYSGYRFCKLALESNKPVAVMNLGFTRADKDNILKISLPCADVLTALLKNL